MADLLALKALNEKRWADVKLTQARAAGDPLDANWLQTSTG